MAHGLNAGNDYRIGRGGDFVSHETTLSIRSSDFEQRTPHYVAIASHLVLFASQAVRLQPAERAQHEAMFTHANSQQIASPSRALHLVDLENLAGTASVTERTARMVAADYLTASMHADGDLVVVASSHHNGFAARLAFPGSTVRWRSGRDGADLALLDAYSEFNASRFGRLVIGSGDGILARVVTVASESGLNVTVVTRRLSASTTLRCAADDVVFLGGAA